MACLLIKWPIGNMGWFAIPRLIRYLHYVGYLSMLLLSLGLLDVFISLSYEFCEFLYRPETDSSTFQRNPNCVVSCIVPLISSLDRGIWIIHVSVMICIINKVVFIRHLGVVARI